MAMQSILPGVSGLPLSERSLLRTRELSQANRVTTELVDRLSFSTRASAAGIKIQLTGIALQRLQVFGVRHTIPLAVHSAPLQSHHVVVPLQGRMRARSGVEAADVAPGTAVIYPAGTCLEARWPSQSVALIVTISRGEFDRVCHSNAHPAFHSMKLPASVALTAGPGRSFANVLACLCIECNATESSPLVIRGLEDLVLHAMLQLARPAAVAGDRILSTARRQCGLWRALEYLRAHPGRRPGIDELARAACLSRRSLETAFVEHFGVGPRAFVTRELLNGARTELLAGTPDFISAVAARWGFEDASRFARLYRREFGEPPTATRVYARCGN